MFAIEFVLSMLVIYSKCKEWCVDFLKGCINFLCNLMMFEKGIMAFQTPVLLFVYKMSHGSILKNIDLCFMCDSNISDMRELLIAFQ